MEKLELLQEWGFAVDEETVIEAVRHPQQVFSGYLNRAIAQIILDRNHLLRVVYEEGEEITVITIYPGRRRRYEG